MNILARTILRRVIEGLDTVADPRLAAAYRNADGGLMNRIAATGILRLALRGLGSSR